MSVYLLAIESSCDDSSAAIFKDGVFICQRTYQQLEHAKHGGVVPELASRKHISNLFPVVSSVMNEAKISPSDLQVIAATQGPGLLGSLLVGFSFAKSLSASLQIPLIGVNHMDAHIMAHWIPENKPEFPFLCLTVSGGHTRLTLLKSPFEHIILGETKDDAAGEAFDKTAKLLGLPYPGGPQLDALAQKGNPDKYTFPGQNLPDYDFSYSGLKTSILYFIQKQQKINPNFIQENIEDLCASIQKNIVSGLIQKFSKAITNLGVKQVGIAGGVAANSGLRKSFTDMCQQLQIKSYIPEFQFCTDNAAMIGQTAWFRYLQKDFTDLQATAYPREK